LGRRARRRLHHPAAQTAAFIEKDTGDLIIMQDQTHLWSNDVVIRIGMLEVEQFVDGLVAMVRAARDRR
jgi:hypothetical protein